MGFFSSFVKGATAVFRTVKDVVKQQPARQGMAIIQESQQISKKLEDLQARITQDYRYATLADESYRALIYENLRDVPAVELYTPEDSDYFSQLNALSTKVADKMAELSMEIAEAEIAIETGAYYHFSGSKYSQFLTKTKAELTEVATEIQTFLREDTSDIEEAKLWDAMFKKAAVEHLAPHYKKGVQGDEVMKRVMEAYRNWASFAQAQIDMFGSQNLINAIYEATTVDNRDPMDFISETMTLYAEKYGTWIPRSLNEYNQIQVPNAGFFSSSFFF